MNKKSVIGVIALLSIGLLVASIPPMIQEVSIKQSTAQFVLAVDSWSYPDEYGQGLQRVDIVFANGTTYDVCGWFYPYETFTNFESDEWFFNTSMIVSVGTWLNSTLVGVATLEDGLNYIRHSITVSILGETVFSQQNFTYDTGLDAAAPMYYYAHNITLNCFNTYGAIYEITVDYEVYYESLGEYGGSYLHDCSDTSNMTYNSDNGLDPSDYGIGSNGSIVEIWILPDSSVDEKVLYKLDFPNFVNSSGNINLTVRYRVEDDFIGFRLDLYYDDASYDSTGLRTSQTWANVTIVADSSKTLDYALLYCDDNPNSVTSGNRSVYIDFIEITGSDSLVFLFEQWNVVSTATLIFSVPLDYWGLNMILVFGGLILMLVSVCIIAVKVRNRTITNDSGVLLLFLFCVGWGLFIGGTIIG